MPEWQQRPGLACRQQQAMTSIAGRQQQTATATTTATTATSSPAAHRRRHGSGVQVGGALAAQELHQLAAARDVAAAGAKALGEGAHHEVDVCRVHPRVLAHAAPARAQGTDAVGLIQVQVALQGGKTKAR